MMEIQPLVFFQLEESKEQEHTSFLKSIKKDL